MDDKTFNSIYDWLMTNNRRDHLRALEQQEMGINDNYIYSGIASHQAYWDYKNMEIKLRKEQRKEVKEEKDESKARIDGQKESFNSRIQGFLKSAGVEKEIKKTAGRSTERETDTSSKDVKETETESKEEAVQTEVAPEEAEGQNKKDTKKKDKRKLKLHELDPMDKEDAKNAAIDFESTHLLSANKRAQTSTLPHRLSGSQVTRPNINSVVTVILANTYAPDGITDSKIEYSSLDASVSHKLLGLAISLENADLLALAEKACGMYAKPLDLELRTRYISFKEYILRNSSNLG